MGDRKKVLVLGAGGFIGRNVAGALSADYEVYGSIIKNPPAKRQIYVDLLKRMTIASALQEIQPQIIINCAGVVENSEKAMQNPIFTENLLRESADSGLEFERIIISGSAAEYGQVEPGDIPVKETAPLNANAGYGLSKVKETSLALDIGQQHNLPVVIARIFNPIGLGMHPRFLIPKLISQVREFSEGKRKAIEVSRLDSKRDYIDVRDLAQAIKAIASSRNKKLKYDTYNVGSGRSTSNGELIELVLKSSGLVGIREIIQTSQDPEPLVAAQADISRIEEEFGWSPTTSIDQTVNDIVNEESQWGEIAKAA